MKYFYGDTAQGVFAKLIPVNAGAIPTVRTSLQFPPLVCLANDETGRMVEHVRGHNATRQ